MAKLNNLLSTIYLEFQFTKKFFEVSKESKNRFEHLKGENQGPKLLLRIFEEVKKLI